MTRPLPLLVFTDLDGTLLSHEDYDWSPAKPALDALNEIGAGIVMASSKTAAEMGPLREALGLSAWPAICENGAGILPPQSAAAVEKSDYGEIRAVLEEQLSKHRQQFRGFGDMTCAEVVEVTGLPKTEARRAKDRAFSEPGIWSGPEEEKSAFLAALSEQGIKAREGGRFLTLSFGQTKADRMREVIAQFQPRHSIALGDAPNDIEMLETADVGVIVHNPHRVPLPALTGEAAGRIRRTTQAGPEGWNTAVLSLLAEFGLR
ncbi:MAG: HAD-IIB family hydrolase [Pseudomonadota bacterium]